MVITKERCATICASKWPQMQGNFCKEYCTWKNHLQNRQDLQGEVQLHWRRLHDVPECPESGRTVSSWGVSYGNVSPPVELVQYWQQVGVRASALKARPRLLDNDMVSGRAAKKPLLSKKTSRTYLNSAEVQGLEDWCKVIYSDKAKPPSSCWDMENQLFGKEEVNSTTSPQSWQQWRPETIHVSPMKVQFSDGPFIVTRQEW